MLLTRYTFVNTLQRVQPLITDWTLPLPAPGGLQVQPDRASGFTNNMNPASAPGGQKALERSGLPSDAVQKRDQFMARMSRRVMKNAR